MANFKTNLQSNNIDLQEILNQINNLPEAGNGGIDLPTLSNEGSAADLLKNKQLIDQDGNIVTGSMANNGAISKTMDGINTKSITIPSGYTSGGSVSLDNTIDNEVAEQADLIAQIKNVVDNLPEAGGEPGDDGAEYYVQVRNDLIADIVINGKMVHCDGGEATIPMTSELFDMLFVTITGDFSQSVILVEYIIPEDEEPSTYEITPVTDNMMGFGHFVVPGNGGENLVVFKEV